MNHNSSSSNTTSPLPTPITRYDEEFFETAYPEDNEFPSYSPTFYEDSSDTVWIRPNSLECAYERDDTIRFNLDEELPQDKKLIVDYVEIVIYATGDHSNLTVELYLDNMLRTSIPYSHYQMTVFDLEKLNISEKDRTLSYSKNIMVRFTQNGCPHLKMGIGCASPRLPAGHIRGRLKDRIRQQPKSTYHYLTDHNKNVTGLTDVNGNLAATWDYDAFGNIIHQTGSQADLNPLRFSSEYHDEDLGLIYYNYRHYNPREGRWISRDRIGEKGGINLYCFINNSYSSFDRLGNITYVQIDENFGHAWIRTGGSINIKYSKNGYKIIATIPSGVGFYPADNSGSTSSGILTLAFTSTKGIWISEEIKEIYYAKNAFTMTEYDVKTYSSMWFTPKLKYGSPGKCCKHTNYYDQNTCFLSHPLNNSSYNLIFGNCRDKAKEVLKDCCMEVDNSTARPASKGTIQKK